MAAFGLMLYVLSARDGYAQARTTPQAADLAAIEQLTIAYAQTLGNCQAEAYADLFERPSGFFESLNRGRVRGRERLEALVRSEQHCRTPGATRQSRPTPKPVIEVSGDGIVGRVDLGQAGHYEDLYVHTAVGWRFRSRNLIPPKAQAAKFTRRDFAQIRALAGDDGQFEDVYQQTPQGTHFRSSGLTIDPVSPTEATGTARLGNEGGQYEDVYTKTAAGWRFSSRRYVPAAGRPSR